MSFAEPGDNIRCDHCDRPGKPYTYRDIEFSGLIANQGERLCPGCNGREHDRHVAEIAENTPVSVIAARYRFPDYVPPKRTRKGEAR